MPERTGSPTGGWTAMWKTIGWLTLVCGVFIGMLISLSIIGLKA